MSVKSISFALGVGLLATVLAQTPVQADPLPWAPAYGHRDADHQDRDDRNQDDRRDNRYRHEARHEDRRDDAPRGYRGYGGDEWPDDYGVVQSGRCNTDAALTVFGAVTGGLIGNRAASPQNRGIATVFGAIAGGILGNTIGHSIDEADRACIGHSLELAPVGTPVVWTNPHTRIAWRMVPVRDVSASCREFDLQRQDGRPVHRRLTACRRDRGDWEFRHG